MAAEKIEEEPPAPPRWMPEAYTKHFVQSAIKMYEAEGLEATVAHYNLPESTDGQWYVFIVDENEIMVAHADPAQVGRNVNDILGPNGYPSEQGFTPSQTRTVHGLTTPSPTCPPAGWKPSIRGW